MEVPSYYAIFPNGKKLAFDEIYFRMLLNFDTNMHLIVKISFLNISFDSMTEMKVASIRSP